MAMYKDNSSGAIKNIHKLLLNTPYGRLGMKVIRDVVKIVNYDKYVEILKKYKVFDFIRLSNDEFFVKHSKFPSKIACEQSETNFEEEMLKGQDNDYVENSSAVASAIASISRIIMYPWIIDSAYTDTDSIYLPYKLPSNMVGKGLGKFKLENGGMINKAMFISPKLYYLSTVNGEVSKTKGVSVEITKYDFITLLNGGSVNVEDER